MNLRPGSALLALIALPAFGGESDLDSAPSTPSAKDVLSPYSDSAKDVLSPSAKDVLSGKDAKDILLPPAPTHRWTLGAGLLWRNIGDIDFDTGKTSLRPPNVFGSNSFTPPPGIGPRTGFFNRDYDDGFVYPGPRVGATGRTTDYGYTNQSQLQGNDLVYTGSGGERRIVSTMSDLSSTDWSDDADWEISPYFKLSRLVDLNNGWSVGPAFHFAFTDIDGSQGGLNTLNASERLDVYDVTATDRYDSTGLMLSDAPYTGSPGAIAPLLPAEPFNRVFDDTLRSTDTAVFHDSIHESLDINLFGLSLGGEAVYQANNSRFLGSLGAGLVLNIADWEAKRRDRLIQVTNGGPPVEVDSTRRRNSGTDVLWGLYFQGSVGYKLTESFSVEANARYDWNQSLDDSVGNSDFDVDLSGFSLGLGCNYTFW